MIGSRLVGKILIAIRSVLPQDKALALASEITIVYIIAHIPGKIGYEAIDGKYIFYRRNHILYFNNVIFNFNRLVV